MNEYSMPLGSGELKVTLNKYAKQADASVMISFENTAVLVTVVASKKENKLDFFPLIVNYDEKLYSAGKIPGNYKRREGQPSEQATLSARMIDRPIRPLFAHGYNQEVQIVCQVMATDLKYESNVYAATAASLALMLAEDIPFEGPIACVNVGLIDGEFVINPSFEQKEVSELDLKIAGSYDAINMVEAQANELSEEQMVEALLFGHEEIKRIVQWQNKIISELNIIKEPYIITPRLEYNELKEQIYNDFTVKMKDALCTVLKQERADKLNLVKEQINEAFLDDEESLQADINTIFNELEKDVFRKLIIEDKYRVDGRMITELRPLTSEIDLLPYVHGSAMFTRGETQVLSVATLGVKRDAQTLDGLEHVTNRPFMLHYNFPPYSVGETGRMGAPGRREIGHGNLAERAIQTMMPSEEEFAYTVRVVSEVLESNGSSSQATICSASMALMRAGVPLRKQVAGIAMGLISDGKDYTILTDIQGLEDHLGDMDFKVAGTKDGICAIQMDIKIAGISKEILTESLNQAKIARLEILDNMNATVSEFSQVLPETVPKLRTFKIAEKQIKDVIGKGGETINKIIEQTNVKIDIEEDGTVFIYSVDIDKLNEAADIILRIVKTYKVKEQYIATVERIESYGAFVKFDQGQDALMHISDMSKTRIDKVEDVLKLHDLVKVEIKEVDNKGRIKVKLVLESGE